MSRKGEHGLSWFKETYELIATNSLCRIRSNWVPKHFARFESSNRQFVPKEKLAYEYPMDSASAEADEAERAAELSRQREELGHCMRGAIQQLAARLVRHLIDTKWPGLLPVSVLKARLLTLARGDLESPESRFEKQSGSDGDKNIRHLRQLLDVSLELSETLWQRRLAVQSRDQARFQVGDVVEHKKFGFRGVVVGWDPRPTVDVSHWDGLTEIENPEEFPFYHVVPDRDDSVAAFGAERPFRYVCEENLQECPKDRSVLDVDLDPDWTFDSSNGNYVAPEELKVGTKPLQKRRAKSHTHLFRCEVQVRLQF